MIKQCIMCKLHKDVSEFYRKGENRKGKIHYASYCKKCDAIRRMNYYKSNEKIVKRKAKEYREKNKEKLTAYRHKNWIRKWCIGTINHHRNCGYVLKFTLDDLYNLAMNTKKCFYCGCDLKWYPGKLQPYSPTLDRIDNGKELERNQIEIICRKCNSTKQDRNFHEFIRYCISISNKFKNSILPMES